MALLKYSGLTALCIVMLLVLAFSPVWFQLIADWVTQL